MTVSISRTEVAVTPFDTTPSPKLIRALRNQRWSVPGAISELVDNGFGSGRGDVTEVVVSWKGGRRGKGATLTVMDNGRGMKALGMLFKLGETVGRSAGDIGIDGMGGTQALLYLGDRRPDMDA